MLWSRGLGCSSRKLQQGLAGENHEALNGITLLAQRRSLPTPKKRAGGAEKQVMEAKGMQSPLCPVRHSSSAPKLYVAVAGLLSFL